MHNLPLPPYLYMLNLRETNLGMWGKQGEWNGETMTTVSMLTMLQVNMLFVKLIREVFHWEPSTRGEFPATGQPDISMSSMDALKS